MMKKIAAAFIATLVMMVPVAAYAAPGDGPGLPNTGPTTGQRAPVPPGTPDTPNTLPPIVVVHYPACVATPWRAHITGQPMTKPGALCSVSPFVWVPGWWQVIEWQVIDNGNDLLVIMRVPLPKHCFYNKHHKRVCVAVKK